MSHSKKSPKNLHYDDYLITSSYINTNQTMQDRQSKKHSRKSTQISSKSINFKNRIKQRRSLSNIKHAFVSVNQDFHSWNIKKNNHKHHLDSSKKNLHKTSKTYTENPKLKIDTSRTQKAIKQNNRDKTTKINKSYRQSQISNKMSLNHVMKKCKSIMDIYWLKNQQLKKQNEQLKKQVQFLKRRGGLFFSK